MDRKKFVFLWDNGRVQPTRLAPNLVSRISQWSHVRSTFRCVSNWLLLGRSRSQGACLRSPGCRQNRWTHAPRQSFRSEWAAVPIFCVSALGPTPVWFPLDPALNAWGRGTETQAQDNEAGLSVPSKR